MMSAEELIEAVKEHKELYDTNHPNYMKTKLKWIIWNTIAKRLHFTNGENAKTMWLRLRGSYRDARRRQIKMQKSGAEHIKPWRYQNKMSFLEKFTSVGNREGYTFDHTCNDSQFSYDSTTYLPFEMVEVEEECKDESELQPQDDDNIVEVGKEINYVKEEKKNFDNDSCDLIKRSMQPYHQSLEQSAEDTKNINQNKNKKSEESSDPLYTFFMSMYQATKQMPPIYQHKVRSQVFQSISDAEADILNMTPHRPYSTVSNYCHLDSFDNS
ncbi:uncharacterized protein LOC119672503 [Teleopsis dalmanni]|uniref:uncharacterized protein LOC119672503 n=1 Tax=Teleopsis dalmanni TaxID=139649 RepID=UPI0018CD6415|nr:uncharacterized protein LOC119672503 [Teleopsis dalmanni]